MNVLIIGAGGREHSLASLYSKSPQVKKVFVAPGNDFMQLTSTKIYTVPQVSVLDIDGIKQLVKKQSIDLVDVAQDDPLAAGVVDHLEQEGITAFGPRQSEAEIEWNKAWARTFMQKYGLPSPSFQYFSNVTEGIKYVQALPDGTVFIKASGLAAGKGVIRADTKEQAAEAIKSMKQFGKSGEMFLIEEGMVGEEFSLFAICDGKDYLVVNTAQDHKTVYEADQGPNTGGMGCVSPVKVVSKRVLQQCEKYILKPFLKGMQKEGRAYKGILYLGGMLTLQGVKIVEFNARWGDPEAEVILPGLQIDYAKLVNAALTQKLKNIHLKMDEKVRISIAGCSRGYPNDYSSVKGKEMFGLQEVMKLPGITIFGAGIKKEGRRFFANGGRIFHLVAEGNDILEARKKAYEAMSLIFIEGNNLHYRTDIGWRDVRRVMK